MAEITSERKGQLQRGIFHVLLEQTDGLQAKDVVKEVERIVPPTEWEQSCYPNNPTQRRYDKIVRFVTIGPVKAGWMVKDKGNWSLTDDGRSAYNRYTSPAEFARESGRLYRKWKMEQPENDTEEVIGVDESTEAAATLEEAEEAAWTEIENYLSEMNPYDFQNVVAGLLRGMGYHVSWVAPPGRDSGTDIIDKNPAVTKHIPASQPKIAQKHEITNEDAWRIMDKLPDAQWRLLFALARWGGLRIPSEPQRLRWSDIDWERGRLTVYSPKTEHHDGHDKREIPMFDEIRTSLLEWSALAPKGEEYVLPMLKGRSNAYCRKPVLSAIKLAGLQPWSKLFTALRATRDTELRRRHPGHVVDAWIGHDQDVAKANYAQITETDFQLALAGVPRFVPSEGSQHVVLSRTQDEKSQELAWSCMEVTNNGRNRTTTSAENPEETAHLARSGTKSGTIDPNLRVIIDAWHPVGNRQGVH